VALDPCNGWILLSRPLRPYHIPALPVNSLADTLWTIVRWAVPVTVAGVVAAGAIGSSRIGEEVRGRVEARLAAQFPTLTVQVQGASLVEGEGIVVRGVSLVDPKMPQQWRQILWVDEVRLACTTNLTELATGPPRITGVRLRRPVVHAVRAADGGWNLQKLWGGEPATGLVPISVEDATLLVDDPSHQFRATLRQVSVDVEPDGHAQGRAVVRGSAAGDRFERLAFQGRITPQSGAFELQGQMEEVDVSNRLVSFLSVADDRLGAPNVQEWLAGLRGRGHVQWHASGTLQAPEQIAFTAAGSLESGRFEHRALPFALSDLSATFRADRTGLVVERFEAHSGSTLVRGGGRLAGWHPEADFEATVEAERLTVGRQWEAHLPERFAAHWRKVLPAGEVDLVATVRRRAGRFEPTFSVRCRNASLTYYRFPYRLDRTVGTVVLEGEQLSIHLTGQAGGHPVQVQGMFRTGVEGVPGFVEVRGDGMRIDDALLAALPPRSAGIVKALHAQGTFDFAFRHDRAANLPGGFTNTLGIRLVQCSMSYAGFPYPLSNVSGTVRLDRGHWTIKDVVGSNDTGVVRCNGALVPVADDDGELTLHLAGSGVVLDQELRDALPRTMVRIWDDIDPRGSAEFTATVRHQVKARKTDVALEAAPQGDTVSIEPAWFPYRLEQLRGTLTWRDGLLRFAGVRGIHDRTTVATDGICRFGADGSWHVSFERLSADRFRADHEVLQALPAGLQRAIAAVRPRGLLSLAGSLDIHSTRPPAEPDSTPAADGPAPAAAWDLQLDIEQGSLDVGVALEHVHGGVHLEGRADGRTWRTDGEITLDSAIWRGVQITGVQGPLSMDEAGVRFGMPAGARDGRPRRLSARVAGGTVFVDGSVAAGDAGTFAVSASLADAELQRLAADALASLPGTTASQQYRGKVFGAIEVSGSRAGAHSLVGRGQLRLREADIYELPVVVALLKVLRVKAPDRKAFSSSLVDFRIEGPHAYLDNLELSGDAISLVGNGEVDIEGRVRLTLRSIMGEAETQLPVMKRVLGGASGQFMLVHVDGTLAQPEISTEAFPTLAAALQQLQSQRRGPESLRAAAATRRDNRR